MPAFKIVDIKYPRILVSLMTMLIVVPCALAQSSSQFDKGTPPQHAAGVSSLGSYTSSDLGTINLSNGALNMKLPLASIGGRGFSLPLTLNYSSKVWSASRESNFADETGNHPTAYADYAGVENLIDLSNRIAPGWTMGAAPTLVVRGNGIKDNTTSICVGDFRFALTTLTVMLPDKGEIQLRDDATDGAPLATQIDPSTGCMARDGNRGQRWHASDGSGSVFISDTANGIVRGDLNGVLILSNGMRYRFADSSNPPAGSPPLNLMSVVRILARGTSVTDRNGNVITITYPSNTEIRYTDQLGRVTKIQKSVPDPDNPSATLPFLVTVPGYQGQNRYFKIKTVVMNQRYRSGINPTLPVINGDYDPLGWGLSWGTATRLFPFSHGLSAERIDTYTVLSEFVLPDGRTMEFYYNQFGEIAEVRLPTGGKLQYDYQYVGTLPAGKSHIGEVKTLHFDSDVSDVDRAIVARRTYADGTTLEGTWSYAYTNTTAQVTAASASGSVLLNQKHYFMASQRYLNSPGGTGPVPDRGVEGTGYSVWSTGVSRRIETLNATGTSVIAASEEDQTQRIGLNWSAHTTYAQEQPENDNRVNQTRRYLENGMTAKTETFYDQYNNPIEIKEYDYDQTLKRRTVTSYLSLNNGSNYQTNDSIHLLSLAETTTIFNGVGTPVAQSTNEYDVYTDDGNHRPLTAYGSVSQHDSNYGVSKLTRGNVTRIGQWLNTTGTFIYTYPRFDVLGNVVSTKNANGKVTTVSFADDFGLGQNPGTPTQNPATPTYALPTLITSPPPLPGAPVQTARSQYDYLTGLLTGFRDRNHTVTQTIYNDPFNRPTQVKAAVDVDGVETHVSNYYAPATVFGVTLAKNDVLTVSDLNDVDDASIRSWTVTDGFGRTRETWKRDPQGDVKVITNYDCLNRVKQISNPFRSATESAVYTTTVYDLAGRVTSVTTPDNAVVHTSYNGNTVTVTDQAGKARKSVSDALGRLVEVYEDPNGVNWQTTYLYDALDNLAKVTQGSQQRFFMYDSLKRLIRARNPEQGTLGSLDLLDPITDNSEWSMAYEYDSNGNLTQRTDARGIVSTYVYDAFNRNTTIDYSDTAINPDVSRFYDGANNGKGRLWKSYAGGTESVGSNVEKTIIDNYDALGRPLVQQQLFKLHNEWSDPYETSREYNRAGGVDLQTYPSQHRVRYNYDPAGRIADKDPLNLAFTGNLGDGVLRTYAAGITYSQWGSLSREQYGTNTAVYNKLHYNIRGQLCDVRASNVSDEWSGELGALVNHYSTSWMHCGSGPDNNGNVLMSQTIISSYFMEDRYSYDALNRLTAVNEWQNASTHTGSQQYDYDRWGNRTIKSASWGTGINNKQFTVDEITNRLGVPGGQSGAMTYDFAGNLIDDTYTGAGLREYDGENRMTRALGSNNQSQYYTYNAEGQRVRRKIDNQETWQIYGFDGELLAEYAADAPNTSPQKEYGYRNGELLITAEPLRNVALASNGATVTASSTWSNPPFSYPVSAVNNGDHKGLNAGFGGNWHSSTPTFPQWVEVAFDGSKTINEIDVFSLQDNYANPVEPTEATTFGLYGLSAFQVQYWNGGAWVTVPGGSVSGNNKVWKKITFAPLTTTKIRVLINGTVDNWSRIVEVEAWSPNINWLVTDHLGTPRMVIDVTGSLANIKRHDYLPFGEELFAGSGGRSSGNGYSSGDGVRQQFTQYERDTETGLDFAQARFYSSSQGRFTSVDPLMESAIPTNPQTFNRYSYVSNSPLVRVDPSGMFGIMPGGDLRFRGFLLQGPTTEQAAQPQQQEPKPVSTQTVTLPDSEIPQCHMCFGQVPSTIVIEQMNEPGPRVRDVLGSQSLVVGVDLRFTFLDQNGDPIRGTVTESIEPSRVIQATSAVPLDSQGRAADLISNSLGYLPRTNSEQQSALQFFNQDFTINQTATITIVSNTGMSATITQERSLTNLSPGAPPIAGRAIRGYTFTMGTTRVRFP